MKVILKNIRLPQKTLLILLLIFSLHLFMRFYNITGYLGFGHDEDLGAWIAKDIIIDHNFRLIGQETSVSSVFIGPLFYYLQALYFAAFNMDPVGGLFLTVTISILTLFSIFYIFRHFFNERVALIASLIYAVSTALAGHDTWIVPTQPTLLWTTWFLFALFHIIEKNDPKIFLLLGVLVGLIWYIHIAFIPLTALIVLAFFVSKKRRSIYEIFTGKYFWLGAAVFLILMLPFFAFEIRHNFMQTHGLINSLSEDRREKEDRLFKVYDGSSWSFMNILYEVRNTNQENIRVLQGIMFFVFIVMLAFSTKPLGKKAWVIYGWFVITILSQLISKRPISEYYFTNLTIPEVLVIALSLNYLLKNNIFKYLAFSALTLFIFFNIKAVINRPSNGEGYLARKELIAFISKDAKVKGYPCIAINYITSPGKNAGFRYYFWWFGLDLISPGGDVAVYSILNPATMSENEIAKKSGVMGVILPDNPKVNPAACKDPNRQLLPLWGFNN